MSCSGICVLAPSPWLLPDTTTMLLASGGCCISMSSVDSVNQFCVLCVCMQTCMTVYWYVFMWKISAYMIWRWYDDAWLCCIYIDIYIYHIYGYVHICIWHMDYSLRILLLAPAKFLQYQRFISYGFYLPQMLAWKYQQSWQSSRKQIRNQGGSLEDSPNDLAMCRCAASHWHWEEHLMSSFALSIGQCLVHLQSRRGRRSPYLVDNLQMMHQLGCWQPFKKKNHTILQYSCNMF